MAKLKSNGRLEDFALASIQFLTPEDSQIFAINMAFARTSEQIRIKLRFYLLTLFIFVYKSAPCSLLLFLYWQLRLVFTKNVFIHLQGVRF